MLAHSPHCDAISPELSTFWTGPHHCVAECASLDACRSPEQPLAPTLRSARSMFPRRAPRSSVGGRFKAHSSRAHTAGCAFSCRHQVPDRHLPAWTTRGRDPEQTCARGRPRLASPRSSGMAKRSATRPRSCFTAARSGRMTGITSRFRSPSGAAGQWESWGTPRVRRSRRSYSCRRPISEGLRGSGTFAGTGTVAVCPSCRQRSRCGRRRPASPCRSSSSRSMPLRSGSGRRMRGAGGFGPSLPSPTVAG